jgi:TolB protein
MLTKIHRTIYLNIIISFAFLFLTNAYAVLDLELTQGVNSATPIAITSFNNDILHDVISKDLKNSGKFSIAEATDESSPFNYNFWQQKKVNDVVTGDVQSTGGNAYTVTFALHDSYGRKVLLAGSFNVKESELHTLAHHISDLVYQKLTGDRGIFSTKIAYVAVERSEGSAKYQLMVSDIDGFNAKALLTSDQPIMSPSWSPDGKQIAYVSFEGKRAAIYRQNVASGARSIVTNYPGINGAPAWSPDGSKMALVLTETGYPKIYTLNLASNKLDQLTSDWYLDTEPNFAPDGKSIIFTSNRGGTPQIYRVILENKKIERVSFKGNYNARPSYSADAKYIVMLHQDQNGFNIAAQDVNSGRISVLTKSGNDESPSVAPNGKMVAYATNSGGKGILGLVSIDGSVKLLLPEQSGEVEEPAWSPFF